VWVPNRRWVSTVSDLRVQSIAQAPDADYVAWLGGHGLDFPTQTDNVIVHGAVGEHDPCAPRGVEQLLPAQDASRTFAKAVSSLNSVRVTSTG
jgi:hypothetical protein